MKRKRLLVVGLVVAVPAAYVLELEPEGNLVNAWGGPGEAYTWPTGRT